MVINLIFLLSAPQFSLALASGPAGSASRQPSSRPSGCRSRRRNLQIARLETLSPTLLMLGEKRQHLQVNNGSRQSLLWRRAGLRTHESALHFDGDDDFAGLGGPIWPHKNLNTDAQLAVSD